jgi:hypothetical protein
MVDIKPTERKEAMILGAILGIGAVGKALQTFGVFKESSQNKVPEKVKSLISEDTNNSQKSELPAQESSSKSVVNSA